MAKGCQGSLLYLPGKLTMQSLASGFTFPGKAIRLPWSLAMLPRSSRVSASYPSTWIVTNMKKASKARYQAKPVIGTKKCSASGIYTESQMQTTAAHRRKKTSRSTCPAQFFRISRNLDASSAAAHKAHACSPVARIRNGQLPILIAPIHGVHPAETAGNARSQNQNDHIAKEDLAAHLHPRRNSFSNVNRRRLVWLFQDISISSRCSSSVGCSLRPLKRHSSHTESSPKTPTDATRLAISILELFELPKRRIKDAVPRAPRSGRMMAWVQADQTKASGVRPGPHHHGSHWRKISGWGGSLMTWKFFTTTNTAKARAKHTRSSLHSWDSTHLCTIQASLQVWGVAKFWASSSEVVDRRLYPSTAMASEDCETVSGTVKLWPLLNCLDVWTKNPWQIPYHFNLYIYIC